MVAPAGVALLPSEPAGVLPLRTAGVCGFAAELFWRGGEAPPGPLLPAGPGGGARLRLLEESEMPGGRRLCGEVWALDRRALAAALEEALRALVTAASLCGALAEVEVVREEEPREADARSLRRLRRDLLSAGFRAREVPHCWSAASGGDVWVGTRGGEELAAFLRGHPAWEVV